MILPRKVFPSVGTGTTAKPHVEKNCSGVQSRCLSKLTV